MTNKPMLSVERELLEAMHSHPDLPVEFIDYLRRVISQPAGNVFKRCAILKECSTSASATTAAAQHQGGIDLTPERLAHAENVIEQQNNLIASLRAELVESYRIDAKQQGDPVAEVEREFDNAPAHVHLYQDLPDGAKLYAEQPAPVAVVMPEKKSVPEPEDYNTNIDEVAFAEGYNDALDDVARLNVVKP